MSPTLEKLGVLASEVSMPQILESVADVVSPPERREVDRDQVVVLDPIKQPPGFVVDWQISDPETSEVATHQ